MINFLLMLFSLVLLTACSGPHTYLVRSSSSVNPDIRISCLDCVKNDECRNREFPATNDDQELRGRETINFLWWGSIAGPKVIGESEGKQITMSSAPFSWFNRSKKRKISNSYVMCLLKNGYVWEDELTPRK